MPVRYRRFSLTQEGSDRVIFSGEGLARKINVLWRDDFLYRSIFHTLFHYVLSGADYYFHRHYGYYIIMMRYHWPLFCFIFFSLKTRFNHTAIINFFLGTAYYEDSPCPPGTYGNRTMLSSSDQCFPCDPGKYCIGNGRTTWTGECDPGRFLLNSCWGLFFF